jgi:uncharacterized protein
MDINQIIIYSIIGIFTGFFTGMFGIGGGSVRIPLLIMTGMPIIIAFGTNMFSIPFTSSTGAYIQRKNIDWEVSKKFTIGAVIGIVIATFLTSIFSSKFLAVIFFSAAIITIFGLYINKINHLIYEKIKPTSKNLFFGGLFANLIIGLRGGSGGTLFPPLLRAMHIKMHNAIATSLFTGIFSSIIALLIYFFRGEIIILPAMIVALTGIIGSIIGSKISIKTQPKFIKLSLALIVLILALYIIYKEFFI